tara:strand:+ start:34 stop:579 length:546 start_codon:yes stop_codon:yes gene_type:complete
MKIKAFHGTTIEGEKQILQDCFDFERIWTCSEPHTFYIWCPDTFVKGEECEAEGAEEYAKQRAFESAQIAAALSPNFETEIRVLEFEFDSDMVFSDTSCRNMDLANCVYGENLKLKDYYKKSYKADHNSFLDPFYVRFLKEHELFDFDLLQEKNPKLCEAVELIKDVEFYNEDLPEIEEIK